MKKNSEKRIFYDKKRNVLLALVGILGLTMICLGSMLGYKILQKQSYEQKIETLKNEKDQQFNAGSQRDHFRKGQAEVIAYYSLQGEEVIAPVREKISQDIKEKLEDKEDLVFYYAEQLDPVLKGIVARNISKQVYDLSASKVEEKEKISLGKVFLTEDGQVFDLSKLFKDASKAKELLLSQIKSTLEDKKLDQTKMDQVLKNFTDQDLSSWSFDYKDSQIILYPAALEETLEEIALPISSFFDVLESSYLLEKDAELYQAYFAQKNKKVVALTFDDGPNPSTTTQALDALAKYNVKATFFVLGKNIAGNEELLKRMKSEGHVVGNHSWDHPVLSKLSLEDAKKQITDTEDALTKVLGSSSKLMRPPYGAITDDIRNSLDLSFIMWNVDSLDWKSRNETSILTEIQHQARNGSIILMHDIHEATVHCLPKVIEYLKGEGYEFVTVPELLNGRLKVHEIYYDRAQ
ncbi:peptidoglycan-N-acetylglucosamine deacetylase PgdA [Streptococcus oralis]|uniref:Peptidoglycan N-acetylglucosamine deacetylase n=1 Tax=Streptococcus oralis TaxID=1303 RepID=A0A139PD30_STROR|nr:polysaccharide deacetylase family protein [Streptococcus oralis]KXT86207.1 Peptidoglycan N-acetylglucosamine deacetylase [Streptococcus oralis]